MQSQFKVRFGFWKRHWLRLLAEATFKLGVVHK